MKYLFRLIGTFIRTAIISLIIAVLFGVMRYIGYLLSWVERPTIENILGMAAILWGIMVLRGLVSVFLWFTTAIKTRVLRGRYSKPELAGRTIND